MSQIVVFSGAGRFQQVRLWLLSQPPGWGAVGVAVLPGQIVVARSRFSCGLEGVRGWVAAADAAVGGWVCYRRWGVV